MHEFVTEAIILKLQDLNEKDRIADLFTPLHGRLRARIVSGKKVTSRLSPHLQVGTIAEIRIAAGKTYTITDAVEIPKNRTEESTNELEICFLLENLIPENSHDQNLFYDVKSGLLDGTIKTTLVLKRLGYDSHGVYCSRCKNSNSEAFDVLNHIFLCRKCVIETKRRNFCITLEK